MNIQSVYAVCPCSDSFPNGIFLTLEDAVAFIATKSGWNSDIYKFEIGKSEFIAAYDKDGLPILR